jgi:aminoglycoside phosphotransferase (APT) family kinase protein
MTDSQAVSTEKINQALIRAGVDGVSVKNVRALSGGAASETFFLEAEKSGSALPLILQRSASNTAMDGSMPKLVQARLQQKAKAAGLPVADVIALLDPADGLGSGYVMAFIPGETLAAKYLKAPEFSAARDKLGTQAAQALAALHRAPLSHFADIPLNKVTTADQVSILFDWYLSFNMPSPAFDLAFSWLKRHLPPEGPPCVVHGDFRSGNLIVQPDAGLAAVLDWELAHIGQPMEDLGWICVNSWRFGQWQKPVGGFSDRETFYAAYERAANTFLDRSHTFFWELYGTLRWGISCLQLVHQHLSGEVVSVERAAVGRRISEVEIDLLFLLKHGSI